MATKPFVVKKLVELVILADTAEEAEQWAADNFPDWRNRLFDPYALGSVSELRVDHGLESWRNPMLIYNPPEGTTMSFRQARRIVLDDEPNTT